MTRKLLKTTASALAITFAFSATGALAQNMPSKEEMWQMIQQQQEQIKKLEAIVGVTTQKVEETAVKVAETEKKVEATGAALDNVAVTASAGSTSATTIGGYTELHYNGGDADQIDLHRFVLFLGHEFNDNIRFFSELEVEHSIAGEGQVGAVELEQAFVEMDLNENTRVSVGQLLIPVGILNETHEPPTFYGVERNNVEKNIVPATWWEAGVKLSGNLTESFSYDLVMHSGLDTTGAGYKIRSGRQKVGNAPWKNTAFTARASWQAMPGVKFAGTFQYQDDITQSGGLDQSASATLFEAHANVERAVSDNGTFGLRALYAQWNINADQADLLGRDTQRGWYIEPSYKITLDDQNAVGFFARYSVWDNEAGDSIDSAYKQTNFGVNYWPHKNVVLKMDYQIDNFASESKEDNRLNLGVGLYF
ncbi:porin [Paremcibacter congregatus]|uniref:porin n=1 Tax=Paremcibacter congregatus TaxID=2043170 RepID=UPI0030EEDA6A|tara:strand:- start:8251 stop:9516 length:1266 start_codon:yes stop_codon:yes gene_type:complete